MTTRILLPGAGTGAANNLIRSLWADYPGLVVVGVHGDRFTLRNSKANRNYLLPSAGDPRFADALSTIIEREQIDLLMPNSAADVGMASELRDVLPCRTFLPSKSAIDRCGNPDELRRFLRAQPSNEVQYFRCATSMSQRAGSRPGIDCGEATRHHVARFIRESP